MAESDSSSGLGAWSVTTCRALLRWLQTDSPAPTSIGRAIRWFALLPPFGIIVIIGHLAARLGKPLQFVTRPTCGGQMRAQLPDLVQMYIHVFGVWEPDLTEFIARRLDEGDGFIDIGANVGYFSILAARCVGRTGLVASIEASPDIAARLDENIKMNESSPQIRLIQKAASDAPGTLKVFSGPFHNLGKTTTTGRPGMAAEVEVEALTLGQLLTSEEISQARVIKIDVEGGERSVLDGMGETISQLREDVEILVEMSPAWWPDRTRTPDQVLKPFTDAGFKVYVLPNSYWPFRYLWPKCVTAPRRWTGPLDSNADRYDLVLSRIDAEQL